MSQKGDIQVSKIINESVEIQMQEYKRLLSEMRLDLDHHPSFGEIRREIDTLRQGHQNHKRELDDNFNRLGTSVRESMDRHRQDHSRSIGELRTDMNTMKHSNNGNQGLL